MPGQPAQPKPAKSGDVALAGPDGNALTKLIRKAEDEGTATLSEIMSPAVRRLAAQKTAQIATATNLFTAPELAELTAALAKTIATGSGLGHFRIRERQLKVERAGVTKFAEDPFAIFGTTAPEGIPLLEPQSAVEYFRSLIPRIGIDPIQWAPIMQRTAMTLAAATESTLVGRVQSLILAKMRSGAGYQTAPAEIQRLLDEVGVTPANPQYSQMVFRTNMMDSYNVGLTLELEDPDVKNTFPVWQYFGIADGRQGLDHWPRFNLYYPNTVTFQVVRGKRVWNCRCTFAPVDRILWRELQGRGTVLSVP